MRGIKSGKLSTNIVSVVVLCVVHPQCTINREDCTATVTLAIRRLSNEISKAFCRLGVTLEDLLSTICLLDKAHFFSFTK